MNITQQKETIAALLYYYKENIALGILVGQSKLFLQGSFPSYTIGLIEQGHIDSKTEIGDYTYEKQINVIASMSDSVHGWEQLSEGMLRIVSQMVRKQDLDKLWDIRITILCKK